MKKFNYKRKDKLIKLFRLVKTEMADGSLINKKVYLFPKDVSIKAFVQDSATSINNEMSIAANNKTTSFIINYRRGICGGDYVEYHDECFRIAAPDELDHQHGELKLVGELTPVPEFDAVEYTNLQI